jgi:hypothetical protein
LRKREGKLRRRRRKGEGGRKAEMGNSKLREETMRQFLSPLLL